MKPISRRSFMKKTLVFGAASVCGNSLLSELSGLDWQVAHASQSVDLSVVKGSESFLSTLKAVEQLGGMNRFVSRNSRVGLLVNSPFKNYGAHVKPEIVLAVVKMCYEAGAKEIICLKEAFNGYWERSSLSKEYADQIKSLKAGWEKTVKHHIPGAITLKEPAVMKDLLECDVFINVSITKNHSGTNFSCTLKNMMGASTTKTNLYMHFAGKKGFSWYADLDFMSQCIADLNLVRKPDLCISDSTEFIIDNGPSGPGTLLKPQKVVAGTDGVLVDSYCCSLMNLKPAQIGMIQKAAAHNLGKTDLGNAKILEVQI